MNPKKRRIIFFALAMSFLIAGTILVLYADGWRININPPGIVKTGAIQLNLKNIKDVKVKINAKYYYPKSQKEFVINGVKPGVYNLEITKTDYQAFKKQLKVASSQITIIIPVVLIPTAELAALIKSGVKNFALKNNMLVWQDQNDVFFFTNLNNLESSLNLSLLFKDLKERQLNFPGYVPIEDIIFGENPNHFIIKTGRATYLLDIKKMRLQLTEEEDPPYPPSLYSLDQEKIAAPTDDQNIIVISGDKSFKFNLNSEKKIQEIAWYKDSAHIFIKYPDAIYFLEIDEKNLPFNYQPIAKGVKKYAYDPDKNRLYLLINGELKALNF